MREEFKVVQYERKSGPKYNLDFLNLESAKKVQSFHASFPVYKETPLVELKHTAKSMGLGNIYIKDESYRFGLNAFKACIPPISAEAVLLSRQLPGRGCRQSQ